MTKDEIRMSNEGRKGKFEIGPAGWFQISDLLFHSSFEFHHSDFNTLHS
jgi:hypothetical protein